MLKYWLNIKERKRKIEINAIEMKNFDILSKINVIVNANIAENYINRAFLILLIKARSSCAIVNLFFVECFSFQYLDSPFDRPFVSAYLHFIGGFALSHSYDLKLMAWHLIQQNLAKEQIYLRNTDLLFTGFCFLIVFCFFS